MVKPFEEITSQSSQLPFLPPNSTIVQCPSCRTRFAVDKGTIAGLDFPKFHCSRCDHVFSLGESPVHPIREPIAAPQKAMHEDKALEIPSKWDGYSSKAPHESINDDSAGIPDERDQMSFGFEPSPSITRPKRTDFPTDDDFFDSDKFELGTSVDHNSKLLAERAKDFTHSFAPSAIDVAAGLAPSRSTQGWKAFSYISIPLLSFLLLIIGACYYFQDNLTAAASFTSTLFPKAPQIAPAGVQISDSKLKKMALDTGEEVYVISGSVKNKSDNPLTNVILEGFLFNDNGQTAVSLRANLNSTLASTRVRSLTPDMIQSLQKESAVRPYSVSPNEEMPFTLALFAPSGTSPQYYGVRIYSAR